jgi:hypothetical protein
MTMALRLAVHRDAAGGPCPSHQSLLAQVLMTRKKP